MILGKTLKKKLKITDDQPLPNILGKSLAAYDIKRGVIPTEGKELAYIKVRLARCGLTKEETIKTFWGYMETLGRDILKK